MTRCERKQATELLANMITMLRLHVEKMSDFDDVTTWGKTFEAVYQQTASLEVAVRRTWKALGEQGQD